MIVLSKRQVGAWGQQETPKGLPVSKRGDSSATLQTPPMLKAEIASLCPLIYEASLCAVLTWILVYYWVVFF